MKFGGWLLMLFTSPKLSMNKVFAIIDCNNFYVSCERVFRPDLKDKPVVVLSNNDGCVVARSNEVKNAKIPMGVPLFQVKDKLDQVGCEILSSNYALYGDMSDRVMKTLSQFTDRLEIYSIDEAFLDLSHINAAQILAFGREIKQVIYRDTGIPVSVGIAETKTLAKLANEITKKDTRNSLLTGMSRYKGVLNLYKNPYRDDFLKKVDVGDVWGIGRKLSKKLQGFDVFDAYTLTQMNDDWIKKQLGVEGLKTVRELRGISCINLDTLPDAKKSIVSSRSFGRSVTQLFELQEAAATYTTRIGEKLRKQGSVAGYLSVFLIGNRFKHNSYYNSIGTILPSQTAYTPELIKYARELVEKIYKPNYKYQKVGVMAYNIAPNRPVQINLFEDPKIDKSKQQRLMKVTDFLNAKYGSNTIKMMALGVNSNWSMRAGARTPRYTTVWNEILKV